MTKTKRRMTADLAAFARAQRRAYMAGYHTSQYDTHTQAIREHVRRGNVEPKPSAPEAFAILNQENLIGDAGFTPLLDVTPE